jgi:rare lipoprotein A
MRTGIRSHGHTARFLRSALAAALIGLAPLAASSAAAPEPGSAIIDTAATSAMDELAPIDPAIIPSEPAPPAPPRESILGRGSASYYAARFQGRRTASGEAFDNRAMTAAHRTLPFGSLVRVTNPATGASVVVKVNDRGPFSPGRTIDVSRAAAEQLGLIAPGHATVELALIEG